MHFRVHLKWIALLGCISAAVSPGCTDAGDPADLPADMGAVPKMPAAAAKMPTDAAQCNAVGEMMLKNGESFKAVPYFDEAIRLNAKLAIAYSNRGLAMRALAKPEQAIRDYDEAIRLDPKSSLAYTRRAYLWYAEGAVDRALDDLSAAIKADPSDWGALSDRANLWMMTGHADQAILDDTAALKLNPNHPVLICNRGQAEERLKDYAAAINDFEESIRLDPTYEMPLNNLAWVLATCHEDKFRDGKRAVELATKACELTKYLDAPAVDTLAAAYAETGDFHAAVRWEEKAVNLQPLIDTYTRYHAALAKFKDHKRQRE